MFSLKLQESSISILRDLKFGLIYLILNQPNVCFCCRYIMSKGKLKKTAFPFRSSFQSSSRETSRGSRGANWNKLTEKYSLNLLKSQIIKATRRRDREGNNGSIPRQSYAGPQVMPKPVHIPPRDVEEDAFIGISDAISGSFTSPCPRVDIRMMDCPGTSNGRLGDDDQDDLVKVVRNLLDKEDQQTKDDQIRREWRMLAETVDCWLFWSFFFITTISTLLFLVILPYSHRGKFF